MKLYEELKEQQELYAQLQNELQEHFPAGQTLDFALMTKRVHLSAQLLDIEQKMMHIRHALDSYDPRDEYAEVIDYCLEKGITPEQLMDKLND